MANATQAVSETPSRTDSSADASGRPMGYVIVCAVPAIFWTLLLALAGWAWGVEIGTTTLIGTALAISGFLAAVFASLTINARSDS